MRLQFLGSGSAFTDIKDNFQSNMILKTDSSQYFLIDCGSDVRHALNALGIDILSIHSLCVTHQHADHVGGLECFGFMHKFLSSPTEKPNLYINKLFAEKLWHETLKGGMETLSNTACCELSDFFNLVYCDNNGFFNWEKTQFQLIPTIHFYNGKQLKPSYGLMICTPQTKVFISGDTQFTPELLMPFYHTADIIFHDCDTSKYLNPVHSNFSQLLTLPESIKQKMWLYHYHHINNCDVKQHGFAGFVSRFQEFNI
jgi:ribonuclease BN (tRNA processing enzyme)